MRGFKAMKPFDRASWLAIVGLAAIGLLANLHFFVAFRRWDIKNYVNYVSLVGDPRYDTIVVTWWLQVVGYFLILLLAFTKYIKYASWAAPLILIQDWYLRIEAYNSWQMIGVLIPLSGLGATGYPSNFDEGLSVFYKLNLQTVVPIIVALLALRLGLKYHREVRLSLLFARDGKKDANRVKNEQDMKGLVEMSTPLGSNPPANFCSQCGVPNNSVNSNFCQNCGANFRGSKLASRKSLPRMKLSKNQLAIAVGAAGFLISLVVIGVLLFGQDGRSANRNNPAEPVVDSYQVGLNAGKGLKAQNTLLFPNRTALCGEAFQNYTAQNLDFDEFMRGCQDGF